MKLRPKQNGMFPVFRGLWLILIFILSVSMAYTQNQITVTGTVTDDQTGDPLPGVNIVIEGTTTGTTTDMDGGYSIEAPADATLVFSFVGYQGKNIEVQGREVINVALLQAVTEMEEVVAIGYGTQKKSHLTAAVDQVEGDVFDGRSLRSVRK